ncbi:unnamed protein product [Parnassius apollo]|uniref:(apollo) hypothetical protein n=1 Tax=Parnassius apollo TaxID=110799 RepID=A0A8S3XF74_PARAO|nr:unnamed protein product [Parnassius apollo]
MPKFGSKASVTKTNKRQSRMPLAITSKRFKEYMNEKEREKKDQDKAKQKRKIERERTKKNIKLEQSRNKLQKKKKICNINDVQTKRSTKTEQIAGEINRNYFNPGEITVGDYVLVYVTFGTNKRPRFYVGLVTKINNKDNKIKVDYLRKKSSKFDK